MHDIGLLFPSLRILQALDHSHQGGLCQHQRGSCRGQRGQQRWGWFFLQMLTSASQAILHPFQVLACCELSLFARGDRQRGLLWGLLGGDRCIERWDRQCIRVLYPPTQVFVQLSCPLLFIVTVEVLSGSGDRED